MKHIINIKGGAVMVTLIALISCFFTSCKDNEDDAIPVITGVRVCDPAAADSLFSKSSQGQTVAIIGQHLNGIQEIYINGQKVSFSPTMNTDHSVIITVPSESNGFDLGAYNPNITEEIRIVTSHGECTYPFQVLTGAPTITRIQGEYPRQAGDSLKVFGTYLVSINKVYFTDIPAATLDTTTWKEIGGNHVDVTNYKNEYVHTLTSTTSTLTLVTPNLPYDEGSLVIETAAGTTYIAYTKLPGKPVITSINTDMPEIGETLVIKGREYVQVESVSFGDVTYTPDEFEVAESEDEIDIPITKVPTSGSGSTLVLKTVGGEATVEHFYDYSTLLVDFDNATDTPPFDNGWSPDATYETATTSAAPWASTGNYAHIYVESEGNQWWGTMVFYRYDWGDNIFPLPDFDVISEDTPSTDIYLAMEVYNNNSDYNDGVFPGYLRYCVWPIGGDTGASDLTPFQYDNFEWLDYDAGTFDNPAGLVLRDKDSNAPLCQWYRHVFCIDNIPTYQGKTYKEIKELGISQFRIQSINQTTKQGKIDVCIDNIRLIKKNWSSKK